MDFKLSASASALIVQECKGEISTGEAAKRITALITEKCHPRYSDKICLTHGKTLEECERDRE